jgi:V8-like Glu-specific endopeptidase
MASGSCRYRWSFRIVPLLAVMIALAVILPAGPAGAIINGSPDGNAHPYVGAVGPPKPRLYASGVLISPTVVLTAGHVAERRLGAGQATVTFDPVVSASSTWYTGTAYVHPAYDPTISSQSDSSGAYDLGVIVLDTQVSGISPASLPTQSLLDQLGPTELSRATLTGIGYGISERQSDGGGGKPGTDFSSGGTRNAAQETVTSLGSDLLRVRMQGNAEICLGDSGGPSLFGNSTLVAGIAVLQFSGAGGECRSDPWYQRVDTPAARAFIGQFVTLP